MNIIDVDDDKAELEDQFILRLPQVEADYVRELLKTKPKKLKKRLYLHMDPETRQAMITVRKKQLPAQLRKLPTIIESYKTHNGVTLVKTADICQMLDCINPGKSYEMGHGITPPLKNVKKKRFRKCLVNKDEAAINVQKELFYLLQADLEAVASKFEIIEDNSNKPVTKAQKAEIELFGNIVTDSEESDSNEN